MKSSVLTAMGVLRLSLGLVCTFHFNAHAQGTAFTYQGRLDSGGTPANGLYDFRAQVYNRATAGEPGDTLVSSTLTFTAAPVSNGLFTLTLDFGATPFNGEARWLSLTVRTNNALNYTTLTPRQAITPTPYAITSGNVTGFVPASQISGTLAPTQLPAVVLTNNQSGINLSGTFAGNGAGLTNITVSALRQSVGSLTVWGANASGQAVRRRG